MVNPQHNLFEQLFTGQHLRLSRFNREVKEADRLIKTSVDKSVLSKATSQLDHEYEICRDLDVAGILKPTSKETVKGSPAIVFEDPGGMTLAQLCAAGPLDLSLFFKIAIELVDIIGRLHRKGIVHKDIHSGNIMVNIDGDPEQVYLTGLGIAVLLPGQSVERITPNKLEGTLTVMSPEQTGRMNRPVDFRTDFYSLGAVFYQMLTGRLPFESDDPLKLVHSHLAIKPESLSEIAPHIPPILSDLVLKLLAKDADDRYRSAAGIAADLNCCREDWHRTGTITAFELSSHDVSETFRIPDRLYGRQDEICTLQSAFDRICGGPVELVLVSGHAGIGKTELINQLRRSADQNDGYFITGKCDPLDRKIPCAPFIEAMNDTVDQVLARPKKRIDKVRNILAQTLGDQGRVLTDVIPMLSLIIGEQPLVPELPPDQARNRLHLMLQRLFAVVTLRGLPVVVFLDDLQWADFSTLKMIEILACDTDLRNVLLIGAYRDEEVDETHALIRTLKEIDAAGGRIHTLALGSLKAKGVQELIEDTLGVSTAGTADLAALFHQKTGGNPFFLKRFLLELVERELVFFNTNSSIWQWHRDQIARVDVTDNVVELMVDTITGLDDHVQEALMSAACIGSRFDLGTLCEVIDLSPQTLLDQLWSTIQYGLISVLTGTGLRFAMKPSGTAPFPVITHDTDPEQIQFSFIHDRIQEAAYSLMANDSKMAMHLHIGRLLYEKYGQKHLDDNIFNILGQLNRAAPLITEFEEIEGLAKLNLIAGRRARTLALFESAFGYFRMGIDLMAAKGWQRRYELTKELYLKGMEAAYLSGRNSELDHWYERAVDHIQNPIEAVDAYIAKMGKESTTANFFHALDVGMETLTQLGVDLPKAPTQADVQAELEKTEKLLTCFSDDDILGLPDMKDPHHLAMQHVIYFVSTPAYWINRPLHDIMIIKNIGLLLRSGHSEASALYFSIFAQILTTFRDKMADVRRCGQLCLRLLDKYKHSRYYTRSRWYYYVFVSPFLDNLQKGIEVFKTIHHEGLASGDFVSAGHSLFNRELFRYYAGEPLENVDHHISQCRKEVQKIRMVEVDILLAIHHQKVLNLMGRSEHRLSLIGDAFDERIYLPRFEQEGSQILLIAVYFEKLMLAYLFESFQDADGWVEKVEKDFYYVPNVAPYLCRCHFYIALALLAECQAKDGQPDSALFDKAAAHQQRLQVFANAAPMNFMHLLYLIKAERARVEGLIFEAQEHYDRAIELAQENGYPQEQALANELAARFWMGRGKASIARLYMEQALEGYTRWGSFAKVNHLQENHPGFFMEEGAKTVMAPDQPDPDLDIMSALRASRAISGEIELNRLVEKLMSVVIENAGASQGLLLLETDGSFFVAAEATNDQPVEIIHPEKAVAVDDAEHLFPMQIIHYVQRTGKPLVIEDATANKDLGQDPYIVKNRPLSVLCSPIVRKESLIGLLYLENNLAVGAFSKERLKMLEILSAQIAISLENAKLYTERYKILNSLEIEHAQLLSIFDSMDEVIYIADPQNYDLLYGNEVFRKNWGDSLGQKCYRALQGRDDPCPFCSNDKIFGENLGKTYIWELQNEVNHRWYRCIDRAIKWTDGSMVRFEMAIDNHDLKMAEIELTEYREHLEKLVEERTLQLDIAKNQAETANEAKSDFLARMSHDIRTPLNAVIGMTSIVLKTEMTTKQREYLHKVQIASNNLLSLINDILDFSKVEAGKLELEQAPFNLDMVMEQLADMFSERVSQKDLELIFSVDPQTPRLLRGDAARLNQVLINLLENGIKFSDRGEIVVKVREDDCQPFDQDRHLLLFEVSDTGVGITAGVLPTLFDAFTQADGSLTRRHQGTGLGLAICRQLVELMGGRIWAESTPGKGSSFFFTISVASGEEEISRFGLPAELHGLKSLVVDDSESARTMLVELLTSFGFEVAAAETGEDAIRKLRQCTSDNSCQLVLMDWKMPGMDGLETARAIHDDPKLANLPIIILVTSYGVELISKRLDTSVVDKLLLKPVKPSQLFNAILELVAQKESTMPDALHEPALHSVPELMGRRILVVDDSQLNLDVAVALLETAGLAVETAENGKVGIDKIRQAPQGYYDAVFMDIQMPILDGYQATREIREFERQLPEPHIPIIALTAHALKGEKEKCLNAGMNDYISKPINEQELHQVLIKWVVSQEGKQVSPDTTKMDGCGSTAVIDMDGALKNLGGRRDLYFKILDKFVPESGTSHQKIANHLAAGDREAAGRTAHTVKSSARIIGALALGQVAEELENAIKLEAPNDEFLLDKFKTEMAKTLEHIERITPDISI